MKKIWVLLVVVGMFFVCNAGAVNVITKVTNPENGSGEADGIQPGGDRENSYSWCMDILHQEDGDYLYVGSNRDVLSLLFVVAGRTDLIEDIFTDIPIPAGFPDNPPDLRARIFRWKITDPPGNWEWVYTSPYIAPGIPIPREIGYRGAITFSDENGTDTAIYIVTSAFPNEISMSTRVLKFPYDFKPGDEPKEVLRIVSSSQQAYTLRPIAKYNKKLYVGTSENEIYESSLPEVQPAAGWPPNTSTEGWEVVATDEDFNGAKQHKYFLWQFQEYAGYLYVILGSAEPDDHEVIGFFMYRGKPNPDSPEEWVWEEIIGEGEDALYPPGMGNKYHGVACMSVFKDYLYVGTFNDITGPMASSGGPTGIIYSLHPPKIFRFDANNNCQMIIGDTKPDSEYEFLRTRLGNYGSGFYNIGLAQRLLPLPDSYAFFKTLNLSMNQYIWWMETYNGKLYCSTFDLRTFLKYIDEDALREFGITKQQDIDTILQGISIIEQINNNPAGFDIYVTSDGINWSPLTTDGFGDEFNYGGRVMKSTDDTMYVGTANPFYGGQVWTVTEKSVSGGGGGGGCFIATAAFGSPFEKHVKILREFRDKYLLTNTIGSAFVKWYYRHSPKYAKIIAGNEVLKVITRICLILPIIIAYLFVKGLFWYFVFGFGVVSLAFVRRKG